jgi:hypothetical protein
MPPRVACYLTPAEEATPGGRTNRLQRMRLDLGTQSAGRPPAPSTSDATPRAHFQGKTVLVSGTVTLYREKPRIKVEDPDQIKLVDKE